MSDTIFIRQGNITTNGLFLTKRHALRVILSGAAQRCNGKRKSLIIAAESNPEGTPAGGISALVYGNR